MADLGDRRAVVGLVEHQQDDDHNDHDGDVVDPALTWAVVR
jgi:hypothetical protein